MLECLYHKEVNATQLLPVHFQETQSTNISLNLSDQLLLFRLVNGKPWNIRGSWWVVNNLSCLQRSPLISVKYC